MTTFPLYKKQPKRQNKRGFEDSCALGMQHLQKLKNMHDISHSDAGNCSKRTMTTLSKSAVWSWNHAAS